MSRCYFTPEATSDLQNIHDYIASYSIENALRLVDRLEDQCLQLADHPYIGVARPEFGPTHRTFVAPGTRYIIVYRPAGSGVEIIHVRHGSQDMQRLFG